MKYILAFSLIPLIACTDASMARFNAIGTPGKITCYSGGQVIYSGKSTGVISSEEQSDGWFLKDAATGKLIRVSGACVIEN